MEDVSVQIECSRSYVESSLSKGLTLGLALQACSALDGWSPTVNSLAY